MASSANIFIFWEPKFIYFDLIQTEIETLIEK